ncbi:MAG: exodeoxyribonuclease VII large subunit [Gemmatimonadaceae bacterium]
MTARDRSRAAPRQEAMPQAELGLDMQPRAAAAPPNANRNAGRPPAPQGSERDVIPGGSRESAIAVSTLTAIMRDVLEGAFPALWIRGEVIGLKKHQRGHWYFQLKDKESSVRCVVWATDVRQIPAPPDEGMAVLLLGRVSMYAARGEAQLRVLRLEGVGDGLWRKAFEQTRSRLDADGLLAPQRKRTLPSHPRRVAIITSADGAALRDIVAVVRKRCPIVQLVLIPAAVQGEGAPAALRAALRRLTKWGDADVLIFGRGGGSREDLAAFNDERVARALAACPIPTISAVGHEVDFTICDLVADSRAATPSAAAELAVPELHELKLQVADRARGLRRGLMRLRSLGGQRLNALEQALTLHARRSIQARHLRIESLGGRLHALSPLATLGRGYALVARPSGEPILDAKTVRVGDAVHVRLRDGTFGASVNSLPDTHPSR